MPVSYYKDQFLQSLVPFQANEIMRAVKLSVASLLYKQDNPKNETEASARLVFTDPTVEMGGRAIIEYTKNANVKWPFTAYKMGEIMLDPTKLNGLATYHNFFSPEIGEFVSAKPYTMQILFTSFFNTALDYQTAIKLLNDYSSMLIRLSVPITLNGKTLYFPIDAKVEEVTKGQYAYEFQQFLATGKIYDIIHNFKVKFFDFIIGSQVADEYYSTTPVPGIYSGTSRKWAPITDMYISMFGYVNNITEAYTIDTDHVPTPLEIVSLTPRDGASGVVSSGAISVTFNQPILEETFTDSFTCWPPVLFDFSYTLSGTVATVSPRYGYGSGVTYSCEILNTLRDARGGAYASGTISFSFTTV